MNYWQHSMEKMMGELLDALLVIPVVIMTASGAVIQRTDMRFVVPADFSFSAWGRQESSI